MVKKKSAITFLSDLFAMMGICVGKTVVTPIEKQRHKQVEQILVEERRKTDSIFKLLLLGAGDSGKTTIIKQMR